MADAFRERAGKQKNTVYTGKMMDLRELELVDIEADEQLVRKAKKRKTHHSEKEQKQRREIEAWPMGAWVSQEDWKYGERKKNGRRTGKKSRKRMSGRKTGEKNRKRMRE